MDVKKKQKKNIPLAFPFVHLVIKLTSQIEVHCTCVTEKYHGRHITTGSGFSRQKTSKMKLRERERKKQNKGQTETVARDSNEKLLWNMFSERVKMKLSWNPQGAGPCGWMFQSGEALEVCCSAATALPFN